MEKEGIVTRAKPEDSSIVEILRHHRFEIKSDGAVIAAAEVNYFSKPTPFYQVSDLYTEYDHQGKGFGSAIMDQVETFLRERKKPGILIDNSIYNRVDRQSFYKDRGWVPIDDLGRLVFNLPEKIDPKIFIGYEMRGVESTSEDPNRNREKFFKT